MIDKRLNNIKCSAIITTDWANRTNDSNVYDLNNFSDVSGLDVDLLSKLVCIAERESQKYGSMIQTYIAPFGRSWFSLSVFLRHF